jgi:EmrB/QacA subfamily drug resistance transporter
MPEPLTGNSADPAAAAPAAPAGNVRWALLGVMLAMLLAMLDTTIVGTSLPTIVRGLGGLNRLSWVVSAYLLATAASTPVWGKFGDLYGRKRLYLASVAVFLAGSALSGAAQSMTGLITARALQGLGAGGIGAGAFALIATLVPPRERGRYQGMTASVMAIGTIGGPLLGGVITGHLGWRWVFYINIPLGLTALLWCQLMLHLPARRGRAAIDWPGITLMTAAISAVVLAATWAGTTYAWASWQIGGLAAGAAAGLAAFIAREQSAREPVLPLRVFAQRNFRMSSVMIFAAGVAMFGATVYLPLFQQTVQGASATSSGLLLAPLMLPMVLVSLLAGRVMSRTGRYKIFPVLGGAFLTAGMALLATMGAGTSRATTSLYMVLAGTGIGFLLQMTTTIAQNSAETRDIGAASAAMNLFRTIGGSIGVAIFGSLFTRAVQGRLPGTGPSPDTTALGRLPAAARDAYLHGVATATQHIFLVAAAVSAAAFLAAALIREVPLRSQPATSPPSRDDQLPATPALDPAARPR